MEYSQTKYIKKYGVSPFQHHVLTHLKDGEMTWADASNMLQQLHRLTNKGLMERIGPGRWRITAKGQALVDSWSEIDQLEELYANSRPLSNGESQ